jgi:hypothetical protein
VTKRKYVMAGTCVYVAAIVLPFAVLICIGVREAVALDVISKDALQMEHGRVMTWKAARLTAFLDGLITGSVSAPTMAVLGGVPFGLYLAIVNMLSSAPRSATPTAPPLAGRRP